jgi:hypothetical protein
MALGQSVVKRVQRFAELPAVQRYTYLNAGSNGPLPRRSVAALTQQAKSELKEISDLAHFEVIPLNANGLRQAIVRPAEKVGIFVEAALVERLVADAAGEPGVLPLIRETLVLLWERVERRFLPLSAYQALVLPRSAYGPSAPDNRTGLQVAMARRADSTLAALTLGQQAITRRMFLRLIQFGEGRADTRHQQPVAALRASSDDPALFDQTLQHLADHRLVTLSGEEQAADKKVDLAHEALIMNKHARNLPAATAEPQGTPTIAS